MNYSNAVGGIKLNPPLGVVLLMVIVTHFENFWVYNVYNFLIIIFRTYFLLVKGVERLF